MKASVALFLVALSACALQAAQPLGLPQSYPVNAHGGDVDPRTALACLEALPLLNLSAATSESDAALARFSSAEGFSEAAKFALLAQKELAEAKDSSTLHLPLVSFPLYEPYSTPALIAGSFAGGNPFVSLPASCLLTVVDVPNLCREVSRASCNGLAHASAALADASYAAESAYGAAQDELDALARLGAACPGFSGSEHGVLLRARGSLDAAAARANASAWAAKGQFDRDAGGPVTPGEFAEAFNSLVGSGGVLEAAVAAAGAARAAEDSLRQTLASSLAEYSIGRSIAESELQRLESEGYGRLDSEALSKISARAGAAIRATGSLGARAPSDALGDAASIIREAGFLALEAGNSSRFGGSCSLADALGAAAQAAQKVRTARSMLASAQSDADAVLGACLSSGEASVGRVRGEAEASSVALSPAAASSKARALAQLDSAGSTLQRARGGSAGARAAACENAALLVSVASALLSPENSSKSALMDEANDSLAKLGEAILLAERDGIDAGAEKEFVSDSLAVLALATADDLASIAVRADAHWRALSDAAGARFGHLSGELERLIQSYDSIRAYGGLAPNAHGLTESDASLNEIARAYAPVGAIEPERALGHYAEIRGVITSAEAALGTASDGLVSSALLASARVTCFPLGDATLDGPSTPRLSVALENPFPFASARAIPISLANGCGFASSSFSGEGFAYAFAGESGISLLIERAGRKSSFSVDIAGEKFVPAHRTGESSRVNSIDAQEMLASYSVSFSSAKPIVRLHVAVPLPARPSSCTGASTNGIASGWSFSDGQLDFLLSGVDEGIGELALSCAFAEPFSLSEENQSVTRKDNVTFTSCEDISLRARLPLPAFNASLPSPVNASFAVPALRAGEEKAHHACHDFTNASSYSESLRADSEGRLEALSGNPFVSSAELLNASRALTDASAAARASNASAESIATLERALASIRGLEAAAGGRLSENEAYQSSARELQSARQSAVSTAETLETAGLAEDARGIRAAIAASDAAAAQSSALAAAYRFGEAAEKNGGASASLALSGLDSRIRGLIAGNESEAATLASAYRALAPLNWSEPDYLARARLLLCGARESSDAGDRNSAIASLRDAAGALSNATEELVRSRAAAVEAVSSASVQFKALQQCASGAVTEFDSASTLSDGNRRPAGSSLAGVDNGSSLRAALVAEFAGPAAFFTGFDSIGTDKAGYVAENAENARAAIASMTSLNHSTQRLEKATSSYSLLAEQALAQAQLKRSQAVSILPAGSYAPQLAAIENLTLGAQDAIAGKRFADAVVYSEKAIAQASQLLSAASTIDQNARGNSFELQPVHLLIPAAVLAAVAVYWNSRKPKQKELRRIPRAGESPPVSF